MTACSQRVSVCKTYLNEFRSLLWEMFKLQFKAKCQTAGWEVGTETRHSHRSDWWKEGVKTDMRQLTAKGWPMTRQQQAYNQWRHILLWASTVQTVLFDKTFAQERLISFNLQVFRLLCEMTVWPTSPESSRLQTFILVKIAQNRNFTELLPYSEVNNRKALRSLVTFRDNVAYSHRYPSPACPAMLIHIDSSVSSLLYFNREVPWKQMCGEQSEDPQCRTELRNHSFIPGKGPTKNKRQTTKLNSNRTWYKLPGKETDRQKHHLQWGKKRGVRHYIHTEDKKLPLIRD